MLPGWSRCPAQLTECSSESDVWDEMMGLKLVGDRGPNFFLMARIWSSARKARRRKQNIRPSWCRSQDEQEPGHKPQGPLPRGGPAVSLQTLPLGLGLRLWDSRSRQMGQLLAW